MKWFLDILKWYQYWTSNIIIREKQKDTQKSELKVIFSGLCGSPEWQKSKLKDNNLGGVQWRQKEGNCNTFNNKEKLLKKK